jgi:hypothetical protein
MSATQQSQAIQVANNFCANAAAILAAYQEIIALDAAWTDNGVANVLNALATAALNADGTLGTADGSPNNAHPIDTRLYPTLQHTMSSNAIASLKTVIDNIVTYVNGSAVSATPSARAILNGGTGG